MAFEVSKYHSQAPLGSSGSSLRYLNRGIPTQKLQMQPCLTNDQSINSCPSVSNLDPELESMIENVCSFELNTPDLNMIENFVFEPRKHSRHICTVMDGNLGEIDSTEGFSLISSSPTSPAFYSGSFSTSGIADCSLDEYLNELHSSLSVKSPYSFKNDILDSITDKNEDIGGVYSPDFNPSLTQTPSPQIDVDMGDYDVGSLQRDAAIDSFYSSADIDSLYQDLPLLPPLDSEMSAFDMERNFLPPGQMNLSDDATLESVDFSSTSYDISSLDISDINSSLALFEENLFTQAIQSSSLDLNDLGCTIDETINSFLSVEETPLAAAESPKSLEHSTHCPKDLQDKIIKAFVCNYGDETKPCVVNNVRILTPQKHDSLPLKSGTVSTNALIQSTQYSDSNVSRCSAFRSSVDSDSSDNYDSHSEAVAKTPLRDTSLPVRGSRRRIKAPIKYSASAEEIDLEEYYESSHPSTSGRGSKKRTKMSLQGLSDADKYLRIRAQNNLASKKCREKKKEQMEQARLDCEFQELRNRQLNAESMILQERRNKWRKLFSLRNIPFN